ncbi:MAG: Acyl-CoA dehydrogenase [Myxococcota bacterium]|nr:Acyl-CoA dehydrogenase [Myxococcota bacterium]
MSEKKPTGGLYYSLSDEQQQLQQTARDFAKNVIRPVARHHDETGEYPWDVLKKAFDLGLMNTAIPESLGGVGLNVLDATLIGEQLAWGCSGIGTAIEANTLAVAPLLFGAQESILKKYIAPMTEQLMMAAYCVTEPGAGSDVAGIKTTAVKQGDKYILNGQKMWITNGGHAKWYFVLAKTDKDAGHRGMSAFVVEREWPGVVVGKKEWNMGQRASDTRAITFENVEVPAANLIGEEGKGFRLAMAAFDHTRPLVASAAVGVAQAAMDYAVEYAKERKTFGLPIAAHQAVSFMIADMAKDIEAARQLVRLAAFKISNGERNTQFAAYAKAFAADACMRVCTDAVQVFGGMGYSTEMPVEKLMRDAKIFQIYEGTSQIQRLIIAKEIFERSNK